MIFNFSFMIQHMFGEDQIFNGQRLLLPTLVRWIKAYHLLYFVSKQSIDCPSGMEYFKVERVFQCCEKRAIVQRFDVDSSFLEASTR